ncbi:anaphase-promoting complex subunit Hcn1 [Entophlyctis luteolus]|nr:anaphase-promoting complex subunit Hcn1 [Entophlyctis luteolus]
MPTLHQSASLLSSAVLPLQMIDARYIYHANLDFGSGPAPLVSSVPPESKSPTVPSPDHPLAGEPSFAASAASLPNSETSTVTAGAATAVAKANDATTAGNEVAPSSPPRNKALSHFELGLKWDSADYVVAASRLTKARKGNTHRSNAAVTHSSLNPADIYQLGASRKGGNKQAARQHSQQDLGLVKWLTRTFSSFHASAALDSSRGGSIGDDSANVLPRYKDMANPPVSWTSDQQHDQQQQQQQQQPRHESQSSAPSSLGVARRKAPNAFLCKVAATSIESLPAPMQPRLSRMKVSPADAAVSFRRSSFADGRNSLYGTRPAPEGRPSLNSSACATASDTRMVDFNLSSMSMEIRRKKARENWAKLRSAVFSSDEKKAGGFEIISSIAFTALPHIDNLNRNLDNQNSSENRSAIIVSYNTISAFVHWSFLCPAFTDNGSWISIKEYHGLNFRHHKFLNDGLNPMALFYVTVNLLLILIYYELILEIPYRVAFTETVDSFDPIAWRYKIIGIYAVDTLINAVTPQKPPKTDLKKVRRVELRVWAAQYAWSQLWLDAVTIVPWYRCVPTQTVSEPAVLALGLIYLLRTVRLPAMHARSPVYVLAHARVEAVAGVGNILGRLIPVGGGVAAFIHVQACVLYLAGRVMGFETWSEQFTHWQFFPGGIDGAGMDERYVWMLSQYATLVGLISSAAISYDASGRLYRQKIDELTEYLHWKNIDNATKQKLLNYYEFKYKGKYFEERSLLADMNESLRRELASITCKQLIEKVPFLKRSMNDGRDALYLGKIATALIPAHFVVGDMIINQGEQATEMYFILSGKVNILVNGVLVGTFTDGGFFGEVALIANIPRTASVQAATSCSLYTLLAKDFYQILMEFDDMKKRVDRIYIERMAKIRLESAVRQVMEGS